MLWDLAFAARALRRSPVFTLTAALTIGLGIGASTAIFSVANAVLLRPLPYKDPQQLVVLYADLRARNNLGMPISAENYADLRNGTKDAFEDMAAVNTGRQIVPGADGTPEQVRVGRVTTNFFRVMGATILLGRDFDDADGIAPPPVPQVTGAPAQAPQLPAIAILSYEYWHRRFGSDPGIVGHDLPGNDAGRVERTAAHIRQCQSKRVLPAADRPVEGRHHADTGAAGSRIGSRTDPQELLALRDGALLRAGRTDAESARPGRTSRNSRTDGGGDLPPAHRVRKCCELAPRARVAAPARVGRTVRARRRAVAHHAADVGGGRVADRDRRCDRRRTGVGRRSGAARAGARQPAATQHHYP
ncbi:MAG: hypothetical protein DMF99_08320 [Acidobacteria bacterium]|nr:MAG: hypothetical protein DMF99_08320 [Acidobacteriota bacterium]